MASDRMAYSYHRQIHRYWKLFRLRRKDWIYLLYIIFGASLVFFWAMSNERDEINTMNRQIRVLSKQRESEAGVEPLQEPVTYSSPNNTLGTELFRGSNALHRQTTKKCLLDEQEKVKSINSDELTHRVLIDLRPENPNKSFQKPGHKNSIRTIRKAIESKGATKDAAVGAYKGQYLTHMDMAYNIQTGKLKTKAAGPTISEIRKNPKQVGKGNKSSSVKKSTTFNDRTQIKAAAASSNGKKIGGGKFYGKSDHTQDKYHTPSQTYGHFTGKTR